MPEFKYAARNSQGELIEGVVNSSDRAAAILEIEQKRYFPIRIDPLPAAGSPQPKGRARLRKERGSKSAGRASDSAPAVQPVTGPASVQTLSYAQQYLFTEQFAHLLSAGMTLDEALGILVRRMKHPKLQGLSKSLHQALVDGRSLSQAMREFPRIFSPLYVNMVSAGEASGTLPTILRRLVTHLSEVKNLRDRVQQALVYPAILVVAGIGLIIIFMTVMVPQLTGFFSANHVELPLATRLLLGANSFVQSYWWLVAACAAGAYSLLKAFTKTPEGRSAWDFFRLRIPGYGMILRYRFYAQFARTLGTLIENGVTLLRALELTESISGNEHIRIQMAETRKAVVDGANLSVALRPGKLFPELFLDMMSVGEQTGRFGETMQMIADVYERELDKQVQIVSTLIPPVVMICIATVVGSVVYGILVAVFSLTQGLQTQPH